MTAELRIRQEEAERLAGHLVEAWPAAAAVCIAAAESYGIALAAIEGEPDPAAIEEIAAATARPGGGVWTPERLALLERLWNDDAPSERILAEINKLPGVPCSGLNALRKQADKMRAAGATMMRRNPGRRAPERPAGPVVPAQVPAEDLAEARDMMRASDKCGAVQLHECFGWPMPVAQTLAEALRAELKAAA